MKMNINKEQFNKWLIALYNEKFLKAKKRLQVRDRYCCLGVACKVLIPRNEQEMSTKLSQELLGDLPTSQKYAPEWLKTINDDFRHKSGKSLSSLNDSGYEYDEEFSHPEIAMLLDLVYNYKALD